jgi:hypothetical protein
MESQRRLLFVAKNTNLPLGFIENSSDQNDLQGWCYACREVQEVQEVHKSCASLQQVL